MKKCAGELVLPSIPKLFTDKNSPSRTNLKCQNYIPRDQRLSCQPNRTLYEKNNQSPDTSDCDSLESTPRFLASSTSAFKQNLTSDISNNVTKQEFIAEKSPPGVHSMKTKSSFLKQREARYNIIGQVKSTFIAEAANDRNVFILPPCDEPKVNKLSCKTLTADELSKPAQIPKLTTFPVVSNTLTTSESIRFASPSEFITERSDFHRRNRRYTDITIYNNENIPRPIALYNQYSPKDFLRRKYKEREVASILTLIDVTESDGNSSQSC